VNRLCVHDDLGRAIELIHAPARIVSLVPSVTELICRLGAADCLVGVTRYCEEPAEVVGRLPKLGGTKNPACDRIAPLEPDVVIVNEEENRREDFDRLEAAGLTLFVSYPRTVHGAALSVERIGRLLGREEASAELAGEIEAARREASAAVRRRARAFCPIWRNPWMSFNRDTFASDLLWCAGGANVCARYGERYPRVELEAVAAARPEVVLLPSEPYRFDRRHTESLAPLAEAPAWKNGRVHLVDGKALFWYGPRTPAALRELGRLLMAVA
jgi:ABC-type hemin transport system substrate-binding protein